MLDNTRRLRALWDERPLVVVLAIAGALRLLAAIFSRGFAFHDDHYEVVQLAQRWVDGGHDWLGRLDSYRSLLYPGLHWALFLGLERAGIADPQVKMLVVRLLDGAWSMLTVLWGFRIAEALGGRSAARLAGLLLAAFWIAPFAAVHDLVEVACQPPLLAATWLLLRTPETRGRSLAAGLWLGLAFAIRFQTLLVAGGIGLALLAARRIAGAAWLGVGVLIAAAVLVGGPDWIGYGVPFSSFRAYLAYNADPHNIAGFPNGPWYQYLLLLLGTLVPPASLLLLWGALRAGRRFPLLLWPALVFLVFHSVYPGKQERFLLPIVPHLLVLCALGARQLAEEPGFWRRRPRLVRGLWAWFWVANALLLGAYTFNYSKRTRVAPLSLLHGEKDVRGVVLETSEPELHFVPDFYLGRRVPIHVLPARKSSAALRAEIEAAGEAMPNYLVLTGDPALEARLERVRSLFPRLVHVATFEPGIVDRILHRLNPRHNVNLTARVYRVE